MFEAESLIWSRAPQGGGTNQGRHRGNGSSVSSFVSTLVPVFLGASILFVLFLMLRKRLPRVYQPRSYLGSLRTWQRSPEQGPGFFAWAKQYGGLKDEFVMGHASLDNYLWIRFMRMLAVMSLVGCFITWPILFPVNATGNGDQSGLDILSISNSNPGVRYYAQVFVSWIFLSWVMVLITRESIFFVRLRQHYYLSPGQSSLISSRTILFTNVPEDKRSPDAIREEFENVKTVWFMDVTDDLAQKVEDRDAAVEQLEKGVVKMCQQYAKQRDKGDKKQEDNNAILDPKSRPTTRTKKMKLPIGKKVDAVDWSRGELRRLMPEIEQARKEKSSPHGACFVEFDSVHAACSAMQKCGMKNKMSLTPKEYSPSPETVLWDNITMPFWKFQAIHAVITAFVVVLCLFWSIPVAVIGAITNIDYLTDIVPFLSFINQIPDVILGVVTGLLPVLLLALLMKLVPKILTFLATLFQPTLGSVEMQVQTWYFPFCVIQVFLVTTFASGAAAVVREIINDPSTAATRLAKSLPKASNFYISYFILFGLLSSAIQILNLIPMLKLYVLGKLLDKTPRKKFTRYSTLAGVSWGIFYAKFANLGVIALAYSSIAPLVLGFAAIGFYILYLAFRYNMLFTMGTPVSTRGNSYSCAMQQLTVGIYLSQLCLIGLFALGSAATVQGVGPLVLQVVFLIATVIWHIWLNRRMAKLEADLPAVQKTEASEDGTVEGAGREHRYGAMSRIQGFLHPETAAYNASWLVASSLHKHEVSFTDEEHKNAFVHPAAVSECPQIWVAKDQYGLSGDEIARTKKELDVQMTDDGAWLDEKGKVRWTEDVRNSPIWEESVRY